MRRPDRRSQERDHRRRLIRLAAVLTCLSAILVACGPVPRVSQAPAPPIVAPGTAEAQVTLPAPTPSSPAASPPASGDRAPAWAVDLLGQLDCDGPPAPGGHERGAAPPVGWSGTASPYVWLAAIDDPDLPADGFVIEPDTAWADGGSHFTRHVYRVGEAVKALILMEGESTQGGPGRWEVTAWQACRASEFDPADGRTSDDAPWSDAAGGTTDEVHTFTGPLGCGWQSTVWMHRGDALYLRDPGGILATQTVRQYAEPAALPSSAVDTGLHSIRWRLFSDRSPKVAWMVRPDGGVEAWPRAKDPEMGCA